MIKYLITIVTFCCITTLSFSQNLVNKVPATASMVVKYSSENFTTLMPLKKIDTYNFIKTKIFATLKIDTLTSIQNTGINFEKDSYQYFALTDSSTNFVTLFYLKNVPQFLKLIDANYHAEMKPIQKNGYQFLAISKTTYIGWNNETAILVVTNYTQANKYYPYYYADVAEVVELAADTASASTYDTIIKAPKINKKSTPATKSTHPKIGAKNSKTPIKKVTPKSKKEIIDREVIINGAYDDPIKTSHQDSVQAKRDAWYLQQDKELAAKQKMIADSIINRNFNENIVDINSEISYKKLINDDSHISLWINNDVLMTKYWSAISSEYYGYKFSNLTNNIPAKNDGLKSGLNLYFDKDKIRVESKAYTQNETIDQLSKSVFDSKQNSTFTNYINPDNLGYLSMSINSEAMQHYYYTLMRQYLNNSRYDAEYADLIDIYLDLLDIVIDEKAIASLAPGNYMFVMHDMKTVPVTYTDYTYDDNFKSKTVIKTKKELAPNFTFIMETKRSDFMKKILNLPLKYAKKENYNYQDKGTYYELVFDTGKYAIANLFFILKDDKVIITTSKNSIDIALNNVSPFNLDETSKSSILNNNYALKIHSKKVSQQISTEINSTVNKKINNFLQDNIGDFSLESSIKNNMIQSLSTLNITGNHTNSLEFIFNIIEGVNNIIENDKLESKKRRD